MATKISQITAREILDSQGWPTVEATVILENGLSGTASVPAGSGLLNDEAQEKRDDNREYYHGRGVKMAVENITRRLAPELIGLSPLKQAEIDQRLIALDGSANKENLGANAILAVSLAVARAAAASQKQPLYRYLNEAYFKEVAPSLPAPIITLFNGGCYADTNLDFQEYSLVLNPAASRFQKKKRASFAAMLRAGTEIYHSLGELLNESGYDTDTGSEGGFAPDMDSSIQAMELIMAAALKTTMLKYSKMEFL
jgi:enolase